MSKRTIFLLLLIVAGLYLLFCPFFFTVDQYEDIAILKTFGKVTDGPMSGTEGAGMHLKAPYPFQTVTFYHARDYIIEAPDEQVTTKDGKTILLNTFCNWRIADPIKFDNSMGGSGNIERAEQFLRSQLKSARGTVMSKHNMDEIVNTDPSRMKLEEMETGVLDGVRKVAMDDYGIAVTNVGIHVLGLTPAVSRAVLQSQVAERNKEAANYEEEGKSQASAIISRANAASETILSFARRRAEFIRTEGQRDAGQYYATFKENERLAMYLRMLESLRRELPNKSMVILDSSWNPLLENFYSRPTLDSVKLPQAATLPAK